MRSRPIDDIRLWETGAARHPVDRGLLLLTAAGLHEQSEDVADLSLGERNRRLLGLLADLIGPRVASFATCPACDQNVEFTFDLRELVEIAASDCRPALAELEHDDVRVRFRVPNSRDLAAIAGCPDVDEARRVLISRCFEGGERGGRPLEVAALDESIVEQISEALYECDPLAETRFNVTCPGCEHAWSAWFDVTGFLWHEVSRRARQRLHEVHVLARAYGWSEAEIRAMSPVRRQSYIAMVGA